MTTIGIDLGGTKTEGIVMGRDGDIAVRRRIDTPAASGFEAIVSTIAELVEQLEEQAGARCPVGICTPGSISSRTGLIKNSNTTCLNGRDFRRDVQARLGRRVRLENDANCFALSEATDGAASGYGVVFGVIMGTGVGGGLVCNGVLHTGPNRIAGEWGHVVLEPEGPPCYCGKRGCVETLLSGPGLLRDWPGARDRPSSVPDLLAKARRGDDTAREVLARFLRRFGAALSMVINIVDPDVVVLGGGLSNIDELYDRGRQALADCVFNDGLDTPVLRNRHGDSSGIRGAARLWSGEPAR